MYTGSIECDGPGRILSSGEQYLCMWGWFVGGSLMGVVGSGEQRSYFMKL